MSDPHEDVVSRQYERWRYPEPIDDLEVWLKNNWQWFDPRHAHRVLWPDRPYRSDLDILIAGCGTNQAAVFAYNNRDANVVAVDVSQASLDHQQYLKDKHGLSNLQLHRRPIEEVPGLGADFDLIVSTGVLHHLADPTVGLSSLARCLRPDGVFAGMLYAKNGRLGVELLETLFRDLGLEQTDASLRVVKDTLNLLPASHPVRNYLRSATDGQFDAVLVDTFLHGRARNYTVADCLDLVSQGGLTFAGWLFNAPYHPHEILTSSTELYGALSNLADEELWSAMECINTENACHFFMACHAERPADSYRIDFSSLDSLDYVPSWRMRCGMTGDAVYRQNWKMRLSPVQLPYARAVDGRATVREIAAGIARAAQASTSNKKAAERFGRKFFHALWQLDLLAMGLPATGAAQGPAGSP